MVLLQRCVVLADELVARVVALRDQAIVGGLIATNQAHLVAEVRSERAVDDAIQLGLRIDRRLHRAVHDGIILGGRLLRLREQRI